MNDRDKLNKVLDTLEALLVKGEKHFNAPMVNDIPDDVLAMLNERRAYRQGWEDAMTQENPPMKGE